MKYWSSTSTLFVLIFALLCKKSICVRKLVLNLRWKRLCPKFNTRKKIFLVKNKGKKGFQNQRFRCKFIHLCIVGRIVLRVQQQEYKKRRIQKQCYSQLFLYFFLWNKIKSKKDYPNLKLQHCHLHFLWELYVYLQHI